MATSTEQDIVKKAAFKVDVPVIMKALGEIKEHGFGYVTIKVHDHQFVVLELTKRF